MLSSSLALIHSFDVVPSLPQPLRPLLKIAYNLWWTWQPMAVNLFIRLDPELWHATNHNPVRMLGMCSQQVLDNAADDPDYRHALDHVLGRLNQHLDQPTWFDTWKPDPGYLNESSSPGPADLPTIAYFSAEYGLTECLQTYSGGLGCLAGDHLKSSSELGLPLVAIGLLYRHGYFQQYLNNDGWQQEYYPDLDFPNLPVQPVLDDLGQQVKVTVQIVGRTVTIAAWRVIVGRVDLYLLDTNLPENERADRAISGQLYGGDMETRIRQEIILGIGGVRVLAAMGIRPTICHMNEGHSAFLALERIRQLIERHGVTFDEARQQAAASHIFTTHTPVPAGIDRFPPEMIQRYFKHYHASLRLDMEGLLALGREDVSDQHEFFSMAVLAIRTADHLNGVSKLHGNVSRSMWKHIWPGVPENELPITHVTNGVHARSWLSPEMIALLDKYLGSCWQQDPVDGAIWQRIADVPDEELWDVHEQRRESLICWAQQRLKNQLEAGGINHHEIRVRVDALDPHCLTVGFARRFATYKRGALLLRDQARLLNMLGDSQHPIQFLIAGKAHPADGGGKDLIRQIIHFARESRAAHKVVFIENYDIQVAKYLVQGCDVWLNTPRRKMEASGTSGMKAAINGALNCSILDGWWDEAYTPKCGWVIGRGEEYSNPDDADDIESHELYDLFESHIIPMFYNRDSQGLPRQWIAWMKHTIGTLAPKFNTNRMVQTYTENLYTKAVHRANLLHRHNLDNAIKLTNQKMRLHNAWENIKFERVESNTSQPLNVRQTLPITATVNLGQITPDEICVQIYTGQMGNEGQITRGKSFDMVHEADLGDGRHRFIGKLKTSSTGKHGFGVRVVPAGELFEGITIPGLIHWNCQPLAAVDSQTPGAEKVA